MQKEEEEGDGGGWWIHGFENCPFNWTEEQAMINCTSDEILADAEVTRQCCIPYNDVLSEMAGYICIVIAIFGLCGNLLTLLTVPWATKNGLLGFNTYPGRYTNIFIVNLAFADFTYCLTSLPFYSIQYLYKFWPLGHEMCVIWASIRYINAFAAWMAVGFVALSRCLALKNRLLCKKILYGTRGYLVIGLIWVYAVIMVIPSLTEAYGQFGYNRKNGKCDFVEKDGLDPHFFFYAVGFLFPLAILVVSYFIIWKTSKKSSKYLKQLTNENRTQLENRDHRLTIMILLVCGCYVVFVGPIAFINMYDVHVDVPELHLIFFFVYWLQYSFNFLIYALRNEQFRAAYNFFLAFVWQSCCRRKRDHNTVFMISAFPPTNRHRVRQSAPDLRLAAIDNLNVVDDARANRGVDIRVDYSMDVEIENSLQVSYKGTIEVERGSSPAIIILPGKLNKSFIRTTISQDGKRQNYEEEIFHRQKRKKMKKKRKVTFYSEHVSEVWEDDRHEDNDKEREEQTTARWKEASHKLSHSISCPTIGWDQESCSAIGWQNEGDGLDKKFSPSL